MGLVPSKRAQSCAVALLMLLIRTMKIKFVDGDCEGCRIIGGINITDIEERPYMGLVSLRLHKHRCVDATSELPEGFFIYNKTLMCKPENTKRLRLCGGSALNDRHVLTAFHCVDDYGYVDADRNLPKNRTAGAMNFKFRVGCNRVSFDCNSSQEHVGSDIFLHPGNPKRYIDIAIVRLATSITFNEYVQPAKLFSHDPEEYKAKYEAMLKQDPKCWVSGFGKVFKEYLLNGTIIDEFNITKHRTFTSPILKSAMVKVISLKECNPGHSEFETSITPSITYDYSTCIVSPKGDEGFCSGDSGGPIECNSYQVGLVSRSAECGTPKPQIIANVLGVLVWLRGEDTICASPDCSDVLQPIDQKPTSGGLTTIDPQPTTERTTETDLNPPTNATTETDSYPAPVATTETNRHPATGGAARTRLDMNPITIQAVPVPILIFLSLE